MKAILRSLVLLTACFARAPLIAAPETDIVPGDNLVVDGIPPIPTKLANEINRYTEFRSAAITSWHPGSK